MVMHKKEDIVGGWQQFLLTHGTKKRKISLLSEMLHERQAKLLGHVMRCTGEDPLYQICFDQDGAQRLYETRRVGRPRNHWVRETMQRQYYQTEPNGNYVEDNEEIILRMFLEAQLRIF